MNLGSGAVRKIGASLLLGKHYLLGAQRQLVVVLHTFVIPSISHVLKRGELNAD